MMYLLHRKNSRSGVQLAAALGWGHGHVGSDVPPDCIVVRYGNRMSRIANRRQYNRPDAIANAADKRETLVHLAAAGVPCLRLLDYERPVVPCLGRTIMHEQRSGFFPCSTEAEVLAAKQNGAEYFVPWLSDFREYRCHVFLGRVIRTVFKRSMTDWERTNARTADAEPVAIAAVAALGLDFGAVDIVKHAGRWLVLEVNTAPDATGFDFQPWYEALKGLEQYHRAWRTILEWEEMYGTNDGSSSHPVVGSQGRGDGGDDGGGERDPEQSE